MDNMERARQYLRQYALAKQQIDRLYGRARVYRDRAMSITPQLSDMPRSDSPNLQRSAELLEAAIDLEAEAEERRQALAELRDQIQQQLNCMADQRERDVLTARYLDEMTWEECQVTMNYSKPYLYEIHRDALLHLAVLIPVAQTP